MFLLRSIKAYLCPNVIDFEWVYFSECRSERFFWRSVYLGVEGSSVHPKM